LLLRTMTLMALCGCQSATDPQVEVERMSLETPLQAPAGAPLLALGAFSCDFQIDFTKLTESLCADIQRDRIFAQRCALEFTDPKNPGMLQKHIPILQTSDTTAFAGGRYLFQGRAQAATYADFIKRRFVYPGTTQFLARPEFSDPECRDWS